MISQQTVWLVHCHGCTGEYGGPFFTEEQAQGFVDYNPLCPECDGEDY